MRLVCPECLNLTRAVVSPDYLVVAVWSIPLEKCVLAVRVVIAILCLNIESVARLIKVVVDSFDVLQFVVVDGSERLRRKKTDYEEDHDENVSCFATHFSPPAFVVRRERTLGLRR